jgi:hypothetical protein
MRIIKASGSDSVHPFLQEVFSIVNADQVSDIAFRNGVLYTISPAAVIRAYELNFTTFNSNLLDTRIPSPIGIPYSDFRAIDISPNGQYLFVFRDRNFYGARLNITPPLNLSVDNTTGSLLDISSFRFTPTGLSFIVGSRNNNKIIQQYSINTAWDIRVSRSLVSSYTLLNTFNNAVSGLAFNKDGTRLFVAIEASGFQSLTVLSLVTPYSIIGAFELCKIGAVSNSDITGLALVNEDYLAISYADTVKIYYLNI